MKRRLLIVFIAVFAVASLTGITVSAVRMIDARASLRVQRLKGLEPTDSEAGNASVPLSTLPKKTPQSTDEALKEERDLQEARALVAAEGVPLSAARGGELLHEVLSFRCEPSQIRYLLELGADPNVRDELGRTALVRSLWSREISELLLTNGADIDAKDDGGRNVLLSSMRDDAGTPRPVADGVTERLIDFGLDPNVRDDEGRTLLMRVCRDTNVMDALLKRGADIDAVMPGRSPDDSAPEEMRGGESLLWLLSGREPALMHELKSEDGRRSLLAFLIERGANVNLPDAQGVTPLMRVFQAPYGLDGTPSVFDLLLNAGADVNATDDGGMTPLLYAVGARIPAPQKEHALRRLLAAGARSQARTVRGETALASFIRAEEASADALQTEDAVASEQATGRCVRLLVDAGVDPNDTDDLGRTPLIEAVDAGTSLAVVQALLEAGADSSFSNNFKVLYSHLETRRKAAAFDVDGLLLLFQSMPSVSLGEMESSLLVWSQQGDFQAFYRLRKPDGDFASDGKNKIRTLHFKTLPHFFLVELLKRDWPLAEKQEALALARHNRNSDALQPLSLSLLSQQEKDNRLFRVVQLNRTLNMRQIKAAVAAGADINARQGEEKLNVLMHYLRVNDRVIFPRNPECVEQLIELGLNIDARDQYERTALHYALTNEEMFEAIAAMSAPFAAGVNERILFTALHPNYRCKPGQIRRLLELGANVNIRDSSGRTPLACSLYDREIFDMLLEYGADVNAKDDWGRSVLAMYFLDREAWRWPVAEGVTEQLIELGVDPNERDEKGHTLLMYACRDANAIGILLNCGAEIDAVTPAWHFSDKKSVGLVKQGLVSRGGRIVAERQGGLDPSDGGIRTDGAILNRSLDMSTHIDRTGGESLLMQLSRLDEKTAMSKRGDDELCRASVRLLVERGANVDLPDVHGHTPLMRAAQTAYGFDGTPSIFDLLLRAGADVNAADDDGMTPLLYAAGARAPARQKLYALQKLLDAGADLSVRTAKGETPLLLFARTWNDHFFYYEPFRTGDGEEEERAAAECIKLLLAAGIGVDDPDETGVTPLTATVGAGAPLAAVRVLLDAGANSPVLGDPAALCALVGERQKQVTFDLDGLLLLLNAMPSISSGETGPSLLVWTQQGDISAFYRVRPASEDRTVAVSWKDTVRRADSRFFPIHLLAGLLTRDWSQRERNAALVAASRYANKDALQLLLIRGGAKIDSSNDAGETILTAVLRFYYLDESTKAEWIRHCIYLGHNINAKTTNGGAVLTDEALHAMPHTLIRVLLDHGADARVKDASGRTCLHMPRPGAVVDLLLAAGADGGAVDSEGRAPLHFATPRDVEGLALLISADRAGVDRQDATGRTPLLSWIERNGGAEGVRLLLDAGADPSVADANGRTLLHLVPPYDALPLASLIASGRVNIDARDADGKTPLFSWMERGGHPDGVRLLLDAGADISIRDVDGRGMFPFVLAYANTRDIGTPQAVQQGRTRQSARPSYASYTAEFLRFGADPNEILPGGRTPLIILLRQPLTQRRERWSMADFSAAFEEALCALADYGADFDFRDAQGLTVWDYARDGGGVKLDLLRRAARRSRPPDENLTDLMRLAATCVNAAQIVPLFGEMGVVDATDSAGWTALAHAAWANANPEVVRWLLSRGADPNHCDNLGRTPLMRAVQAGNSGEVVKALIEGGARIDLRDPTGNDALNIAIQRDTNRDAILQLYLAAQKLPGGGGIRGQILRAVCATTDNAYLVRLLLQNGAPINEPDAKGQTALMHAVSRNGNAEVVKILLGLDFFGQRSSGTRVADVNAKDAAGLSVLDYAWKGNVKIYEMLLDAGADPNEASTWWSEEERRLMRENPDQSLWNTRRRTY